MHEIHAIKNMLAIINEKAKENNLSKITKINVVLGKFTGITKEGFTYWFNELSKGAPAEGAKIGFKEPLEPTVYLESIEAQPHDVNH